MNGLLNAVRVSLSVNMVLKCKAVYTAVPLSRLFTHQIVQTGSKVFHCIDWSALSQLVASASSDKFVRIWDTRQSGRPGGVELEGGGGGGGCRLMVSI